MAIRKYKPTTPGRRGSSVADFAEVTRDHPEKSLVRPLHNKGGRNNSGKITTRHQGGGHKRAYRVIDFRRARQGRRAGDGRAHRVRPEPHRAHRAAALRRRREALHPRAAAAQAGRPDRERPERRHQAGQRPAAAQHPGRHGRARDRAASRWRREDRPLGRRQRAARRQGRPVRAAAHALRRDPQRRRALPRHGRRGRQRRAVEHQLGQGRPHALEGQAPDRPRCRHEPGRPPARWW